MRTIYVTAGLPFGPGEAFVIPEIAELKRRGHDVLVVPVLPRGPVVHEDAEPLLASTMKQPLLSGDVLRRAIGTWLKSPLKTMAALPFFWRGGRPLVVAKNLAVYPKGLWLAAVAREWQADHIHAHWASTTASMAMVASAVAGIPWSMTAHRWDIAENNALATKTRSARFVRAIDQPGAIELAGYAGLPHWRPHVIHMGVPLPRLASSTPVSPRGGVAHGLMAAGFVEKKGHVFLLDAVKLLVDKGLQVRIDFAGGGPLLSEVRDRVEAKGLQSMVRFLGVVPHGELIRRLASGEWGFMVLPSIEDSRGEREGIPVSLMEAMSCCVPVISTSTGGIPELLGDGAGLLVPQQDALALAAAIELLATDEKLRQTVAANGCQRVRESFSVEATVDELINLFSGGSEGNKLN